MSKLLANATILATLILVVASPSYAIAQTPATAFSPPPNVHKIAMPCQNDGPWHTAMDEHYVYWTDYRDGRILRAPLAGGASEVLATGQKGACAIAIDANAIYWTDNLGGDVMMLAKGGTSATILASDQDHPGAITAVGGHVFYVTSVDTTHEVNSKGMHAMAGPNGSGSAPHCPLCPIYCAIYGKNGKVVSAYVCGLQSCGPCTS